MPALRFFNIFLFIFPVLLCFTGIATAAEQIYIREYIYQASEADSKLSARAIALQEVKRELLSELGTHVSSLVKMQSASDGTKLSTEEIETLSAGVTRVEILNEKWDGVTYVLKAQIKADPADVLKSLEKMLDADKKQKQVSQLEGDVTKLRVQNINVSESLTQAKKETTAALAEIARLKKQLEKQQSDASRQALQVEYKEQVDVLTLNNWIESANEFTQRGDYPEAFKLFKKAAEEGSSYAQYSLGWFYTNGRGIERDDIQAVYWLQKGALQGHAGAQTYLGTMYANGEYVKQDNKQAAYWLQRAADQGESLAQIKLGAMFSEGKGVVRNKKQAMHWYQKAAKQNDPYAQFLLGISYANGDGVSHNDKEAMYWYQKAADQGLAAAQLNLGTMYLGNHDGKNAAYWYHKAAIQEDPRAQCMLGLMYSNGQAGVVQDDKQAIYWLQKAASLGDTDALIFLREFYKINYPNQ